MGAYLDKLRAATADAKAKAERDEQRKRNARIESLIFYAKQALDGRADNQHTSGWYDLDPTEAEYRSAITEHFIAEGFKVTTEGPRICFDWSEGASLAPPDATPGGKP